MANLQKPEEIAAIRRSASCQHSTLYIQRNLTERASVALGDHPDNNGNEAIGKLLSS